MTRRPRASCRGQQALRRQTLAVRVRLVLPKHITAINFQKIAAATVDSNWRIQGIDLLAMVGG